MPAYVMLVHLNPTLVNAAERVASVVGQAIAANGGVVRRLNNAGLRPLPYAIKAPGAAEKHLFAGFLTVEFVGRPALLPKVRAELVKTQKEVLRSTFLRADETLEAPPPRVSPDAMRVPDVDADDLRRLFTPPVRTLRSASTAAPSRVTNGEAAESPRRPRAQPAVVDASAPAPPPRVPRPRPPPVYGNASSSSPSAAAAAPAPHPPAEPAPTDEKKEPT